MSTPGLQQEAERAWLKYYDSLNPKVDGSRRPFLTGFEAAVESRDRRIETLIDGMVDVAAWLDNSLISSGGYQPTIAQMAEYLRAAALLEKGTDHA